MRVRYSIGAILTGLMTVAVLAPAAASGATGPKSTQTILRAGVIVAADVPSGWTKGPHPNNHDKNLRGIAACKAVIAADAAADRSVPQARSAAFSDPSANGGKTTRAENTVLAFKNPAAASRYAAVFATSDASECLRASVERQIGSQVTTTVSPITDLGSLGDARLGYEIVVKGSDSTGQPLSLLADVVLVRVGRAVVGFDFLNLNARLPQGPDIVNAVVNRLT
jgi:hypothetical protein